jgi:antirestriction protein ArdC
MSSQTADSIRSTITNTIIDALESGMASSLLGDGLGLLQVLAMKRGYQSRWFGTFNQIKQAGASVKKGEKAIQIVLWKPISRERKNEKGEQVEDKFLVMRTFSVFNVEQTTGLDQSSAGAVQDNPRRNA